MRDSLTEARRSLAFSSVFLVPPGSSERCEARCSNSRSGGLRAHKGSIKAPRFHPAREANPSPQTSLRAKRSNPFFLYATRWIALRGEMDCFASLAMTSKHTFTPSRRDAPEALMDLPPKEGVGNAGCPWHPQPRVRLLIRFNKFGRTRKLRSPDGAQRNPGITQRRPRISLRSIRATVTGLD